MGDRLGERDGGQDRRPRHRGPVHPFEGQQRQRGRHEQRRRDPGARRNLDQCPALLGQTCFEPAPELGRRLDRLHRLKDPHAPAHRRVIAATGRTTGEMTLETPQLSRGGDQPVAKVGIPIQQLSTRHAAM